MQWKTRTVAPVTLRRHHQGVMTAPAQFSLQRNPLLLGIFIKRRFSPDGAEVRDRIRGAAEGDEFRRRELQPAKQPRQLDDQRVSIITYNALNYLITKDERFGRKLLQGFNTLVGRATLISGTGEKERNKFFRIQREKILELTK